MDGAATKSKHQTLAEYQDILGSAFSRYHVYAFARPPLERMISLYYSPNRWMRQQPDGSYVNTAPKSPIVLNEFRKLVAKAPSAWELLDADNISDELMVNKTALHASGAQVTVLDYAKLKAGMSRFADENGFDLKDMPEKRVNASPMTDPLKINRSQINKLNDVVLNSRHGRDQRFFQRVQPEIGFWANARDRLASLIRSKP